MVESRLGALGGRPVEGWVRVGTAEARFNPIGFYLGGGVAVGPENRRLGIAVAHARLGSPGRRIYSERRRPLSS